MKTDEFIELWNSDLTVDEIAKICGIKRDSAISRASEIRRKKKRFMVYKRKVLAAKIHTHNHGLLAELAEKHTYLDDLAAEYDKGTVEALRLTFGNTMGEYFPKVLNPATTNCPQCSSAHRQDYEGRDEANKLDHWQCLLCRYTYTVIDQLEPLRSKDEMMVARRKYADINARAAAVGLTVEEWKLTWRYLKMRHDDIPNTRYSQQEFVNVFQNAVGDPYEAVMKEFGLTRSSAKSTVSRFRDKGALPRPARTKKVAKRVSKPKTVKTPSPIETTPQLVEKSEIHPRDALKVLRSTSGDQRTALQQHFGISLRESHDLIQTLKKRGFRL